MLGYLILQGFQWDPSLSPLWWNYDVKGSPRQWNLLFTVGRREIIHHLTQLGITCCTLLVCWSPKSHLWFRRYWVSVSYSSSALCPAVINHQLKAWFLLSSLFVSGHTWQIHSYRHSGNYEVPGDWIRIVQVQSKCPTHVLSLQPSSVLLATQKLFWSPEGKPCYL